MDGVPVELVVAEPERVRDRARARDRAREHLDALEPLPDAADEAGVYAALGHAVLPPELREAPFRGEPPPLVELGRHPRRPARAHALVGRPRDGARDGESAPARAATSTSRSATTRRTSASSPGSTGTTCGARARRSRPPTSRSRRSRSSAASSATSAPTAALDVPDDVLAELDWVQLSLHAGQRAPRGELTTRTEAMRHPAVRCLSHPTGRLIGHRPENALDLERSIAVALETGVALEVNGLAQPARPVRRPRAARDRGRRARRLLDRRALHARPRDRRARRAHRAPRAGHGRGRPEHAPAVPDSQALGVQPRASLRFQPIGETVTCL